MNKPNKVGFNELNERQLKDVEAGDIYENVFRKVKEFSNSGDTEGFREYMTNLRELLGEDTFNQIFVKRGPLEEGDENRAKLLASMYGKSSEGLNDKLLNPDLDYREEKPTLDDALKRCKKGLNGNNVFRDITNKSIREFFGIEEPEKEKTKTRRMSL